MLNNTKLEKTKHCLGNEKGQIGLLRLRKIIADYFGIIDEDIITNWVKYMMLSKLIKEAGTGQFFINYSEDEVIKEIVEGLDKAEDEERIVNWFELQDYSEEYFKLPKEIIQRCIKQARTKTKYKLAFQ